MTAKACPRGTNWDKHLNACIDKKFGTEMIRENVRIEWENIGEGLSGEYDQDDPSDVELLRFYISRKGDSGEWEEVKDASYCTRFPDSATPNQRIRGLKIIMGAVEDDVKSGKSVKKTSEKLSWIGLDWLKDKKHTII